MVIIKSQDGSLIVETTNVYESIVGSVTHIECDTQSTEHLFLGFYNSEERADEIMKMIQEHIEYVFSETMYYNANNGEDQSGSLHIPKLVFEMPEQ